MGDTMGTKEASTKWGYSQSIISKWCRDGLIPATQDAKGSRGIFQKMLNVRVKSKTQHRVRKISFENKTEEEGEHL